MAELHKRDDRRDWIRWAVEFMRRGLWLDESITVHGPHAPYDYMWGEADATVDDDGPSVEVTFATGRKIRGLRDLRGLRIVSNECGEKTTYPVVKESGSYSEGASVAPGCQAN